MPARLFRWLRRARHLPLGMRGERAAARFLKRLGYTIVARQERGPHGEIDLIAVDRDVVVFVEVKTRRSAADEHPAEAVDREKQRRLARTAHAFLRRHKLFDHAYRFDIVAIIWPDTRRRPRIEHFVSAFEPPDSSDLLG